ncbi:molybdopterin molybdotransferase MoeA [Maribacter sp. MMG018]|uniref:molybdopterin molybdotransferase MoeA n=1 Tax=Maribacter sp. MMG018 TaxID=2822688 RepID=UPI001B38C5BA|nr:molybdopterin molybdotransferase MoeA [Maribacter sp. MMG018]MBQ4915729.1 molybdopterin molybdotransferase MoeA [Maribacter sp. MMG018]
MITYNEALDKVLGSQLSLGSEYVPLLKSVGRFLDEPIYADRDFPPFNRATKDGIAINFQVIENNIKDMPVEGMASAGMERQTLLNLDGCMEVMTGAMVPKNADTVIMYEHISIVDGVATINKEVSKGQNIHYKGSDESEGARILQSGVRITPAEIGVMASVGKAEVLVKKLPKVCAISTGNELVDVHIKPEPHQIRKSNSITILSALSKLGIQGSSLHLLDDKESIEKGLKKALNQNDVLLLSGGVSKGKFDFIPEVMERLGVEKIFHRVAQRPGKPFWFGMQRELKTVVFSFPGNPVSTFANYHIYFLPWLYSSYDIPVEKEWAKLSADLKIVPPLTRFIQVKKMWRDGCLWAEPVVENGSGDLTSLSKADGFICLEPKTNKYQVGELVHFIGTR